MYFEETQAVLQPYVYVCERHRGCAGALNMCVIDTQAALQPHTQVVLQPCCVAALWAHLGSLQNYNYFCRDGQGGPGPPKAPQGTPGVLFNAIQKRFYESIKH